MLLNTDTLQAFPVDRNKAKTLTVSTIIKHCTRYKVQARIIRQTKPVIGIGSKRGNKTTSIDRWYDSFSRTNPGEWRTKLN